MHNPRRSSKSLSDHQPQAMGSLLDVPVATNRSPQIGPLGQYRPQQPYQAPPQAPNGTGGAGSSMMAGGNAALSLSAVFSTGIVARRARLPECVPQQVKKRSKERGHVFCRATFVDRKFRQEHVVGSMRIRETRIAFTKQRAKPAHADKRQHQVIRRWDRAPAKLLKDICNGVDGTLLDAFQPYEPPSILLPAMNLRNGFDSSIAKEGRERTN